MYRLDCWKTTPNIDADSPIEPCRAAVPARFDFIGGWTDTPPYYFDNEARVLNATLYLPEDGSRTNNPEPAITVEVHPSDRLEISRTAPRRAIRSSTS